MGPDQPLTGGEKVETVLGGVQVLFGKTPAPLLYVSATQINAQVPYEVAGQSYTTVEVRRGGVTLGSTSVALSPTAPWLFTIGGNTVAAINQSGLVNGAASPAPAGSIVSLYATGDGLETNGAATGKVASPPYPMSKAPVAVTIGNGSAEVLYAGAAPGLLGVMQINARVPAGLNGAVPVTVTVGGVSSPAGPLLHVKP